MWQMPDVIIIEKKVSENSSQATVSSKDLIDIVFAGMSPSEQYMPFSVAVDAENTRKCFGFVREEAYSRMCMPRDDGFYKFKVAVRNWAAALDDEKRKAIDLRSNQDIGGYKVAYIAAKNE